MSLLECHILQTYWVGTGAEHSLQYLSTILLSTHDYKALLLILSRPFPAYSKNALQNWTASFHGMIVLIDDRWPFVPLVLIRKCWYKTTMVSARMYIRGCMCMYIPERHEFEVKHGRKNCHCHVSHMVIYQAKKLWKWVRFLWVVYLSNDLTPIPSMISFVIWKSY